MNPLMRTLAAATILLLLDSTCHAAGNRPNFVIVLADDLGYGDLGCFGSNTVRTPDLDKFAAQGLKLTSCYAGHANCSPSRTALMTGRTPYRVGVHNWIPMDSPMHLRSSEITVATLLQRAGYATCHVGKWHLNGLFAKPGQPQPSDHGFDYWFSTQNNALPCHRDPDNFVRNGKPVGALRGFSGQLIVDEAIRWIRDERDRDKPFFLYVCFHEPHEPIATEHRFANLYPRMGSISPFDLAVSTFQAHHGNITQMDDAFGRLMKALDDHGLRDNTFVMFTSDNGPAITRDHPHGSAGPLRAHKGHLYEGGIRVPGLVRWPGRVRPGQVSDEPVSGVDLLPTLCAITGIPVPSDRVIDGTSFVPIFDEKPIARATPLYWQFVRAASKPKVAMRQGDWKILARLTQSDLPAGADLTEAEMRVLKESSLVDFEIYNLRDDIGEKTELAAHEPARLASMSETLRKLHREVSRESPTWPNWQWTRVESQRIQEFRKALQEAAGKKN